MTRARLATVWLEGCSGCHMSLLDLDEHLIGLADRVELVYSPLVDCPEFPENVDVALVEGGVGSTHDRERLRRIRRGSRVLVALGDCAVTANVPGMRNRFDLARVLDHAYWQTATLGAGPPTEGVPCLLAQVVPLHHVVPVDVFIPGCPPPARAIAAALDALLRGQVPDLSGLSRFGA